MLVTIRGTQATDVLGEGEERTVELTPYIRTMVRNGLVVQVPREQPTPPRYAEGGLITGPKKAPAKKAPAKKAAAKKAAKPVEEFDDGGIGSGILRVPSTLPAPERIVDSEETNLVEQLRDALPGEE